MSTKSNKNISNRTLPCDLYFRLKTQKGKEETLHKFTQNHLRYHLLNFELFEFIRFEDFCQC